MKSPCQQYKLLLLQLIASTGVTIAQAEPDSANSISFQGALTGAGGQPLANGNYNLTFKFYDVPTGGTALATSNVPNVPVTGGIASTPIPVDAAWFNGQTRYLGIAINGSQELTPRVLVTAVPYAMRAYSVADADGDIRWGSGGILTADQGASLEIGDSKKPGSVPFIDFHHGTGTDEDFNVRIQNRDDHTLIVQAPQAPVTFSIFGTVGASTGEIDGSLTVGRSAVLNGGQIELGFSPAQGIAPPYIDFHHPNGRDEDFNVRMINDADGLLTVFGQRPMTMQVRGTMQMTVCQITSDRNAKDRFASVNPRDVLAKLADIPISTWVYTNTPGIRHIGPVAQDFAAAFAVGEDDKHIATVDADGVALAAIQGLNELVQEKNAKIQSLEKRLEALERKLEAR